MQKLKKVTCAGVRTPYLRFFFVRFHFFSHTDTQQRWKVCQKTVVVMVLKRQHLEGRDRRASVRSSLLHEQRIDATLCATIIHCSTAARPSKALSSPPRSLPSPRPCFTSLLPHCVIVLHRFRRPSLPVHTHACMKQQQPRSSSPRSSSPAAAARSTHACMKQQQQPAAARRTATSPV